MSLFAIDKRIDSTGFLFLLVQQVTHVANNQIIFLTIMNIIRIWFYMNSSDIIYLKKIKTMKNHQLIKINLSSWLSKLKTPSGTYKDIQKILPLFTYKTKF